MYVMLSCLLHRAKNLQAATSLFASCTHLENGLQQLVDNKSVGILQMTEANISIRLHDLLQLVDNKSFASWQNLLSTHLLQVVTGVHIMCCNKPISNRVVVETCKNAQVVTDLVTSCQQVVFTLLDKTRL